MPVAFRGEHGVSERDAAANEATALPAPPDGSAVNEAWRREAAAPAGLKGLLYRVLDRLLAPRFAAQRELNARQVELDNAVLRYAADRFAATHEHYDRLLGSLGRRLDEADERHRRLEAELQAHVRDIVERVDLVLEEATRGDLGRDHALAELRERLLRIEQALVRREG
jgi:hypothetical protein